MRCTHDEFADCPRCDEARDHKAGRSLTPDDLNRMADMAEDRETRWREGR